MRNISTALMLLTLTFPAWATEPVVQTLSIHDNGFEPTRLEVPAYTKVKLILRNDSSQPAEFESTDLSQEVELASHDQTTIYLGPLKAGTYHFFNDFDDSVRGTVIVKPAAQEEQ